LTKSHRDNFVIATKYSQLDNPHNINSSGNGRKSLKLSLEQSLKRLQTDYIDLLWIHAWDGNTPVEEWLQALDDLVSSGKVLYISVSDTPAWVASKSQAIAQLRGWTSFIGLQFEYSLVQRTPERELIPFAKKCWTRLTCVRTFRRRCFNRKVPPNLNNK
jgi:aryl-alcohol dehydrogenase-like predicted oxidoreductase